MVILWACTRARTDQEFQVSSTPREALCLDRFEGGIRQEEKGKAYAERSIAAECEKSAGSSMCDQHGEWGAHRQKEQLLLFRCQLG